MNRVKATFLMLRRPTRTGGPYRLLVACMLGAVLAAVLVAGAHLEPQDRG